MNNNDYEELKRKGYTEEEIQVYLDDVSKLEISDNPRGERRDDRTVSAVDSAGVSQRICPIIMGFNKQGITLENGEYLSWEEVEQTLQSTLNNVEEEVTYVSKNEGKVVDPAVIVTDIFKRSTEKTYLTQIPVPDIANQEAVQMIIHDEKKGEFPKGVSFLGKDGLQLPSGAYVSRTEIETALKDYAIMKEPEPIITPPKEETPIIPIPPVIGEDEPIVTPPEQEKDPIEKDPEKETTKENEVFRVIKRYFYKTSLIPLIVGVAAQILSGFGRTDIIQQQEYLRKADRLKYGIQQILEEKDILETPEEVAKRMFEDIDTGQKVDVDKGVPYYSSSDHEYGGSNKKGVFGEGLREQGDYNVDGFSILKDGKIHEVEWNENINLYETLEKISKETNTPIDELIPMLHVGGPVSGWVDARDLFTENEKEQQKTDKIIILDEEEKYSDVIEDFKGDTIVIDKDGESVELKIRKDDGSLVEAGDIVVGSDGQNYQMTDFKLETVDVIDTEEVKVGTKINWSVKNMSLKETLAIAAATAALTYLSSKKKRKEMVDVDEAYIDRLAEDALKRYEDAKGTYEGQSAFKVATETLTKKQIIQPQTAQEMLKQELIDQNISIEQINNMGENSTGGMRR